MNLLYTKETFAKDFKDVLGFVDADLNYRRLMPHIRAATKDLVDLIGQINYSNVFNLDPVDDFYIQCRYVVALKAYILYAPTADLAVTNGGRLMRRDEHTVSAFQWQIDANDEALEQQYYRQLDLLLELISEKGMPILNKKYDYTDLLVPSLDAFESIFNIKNSFYLYLMLIPALREFENREVKPRMGDLFDKQAIAQNENLWHSLQASAVYYSLAWGFRRLNAQIFPKGILQTTVSSQEKKTPTTAQYEIQARIFFDDSLKYLKEIENWVTAERAAQFPVDDSSICDFDFDDNDGFVSV